MLVALLSTGRDCIGVDFFMIWLVGAWRIVCDAEYVRSSLPPSQRRSRPPMARAVVSLDPRKFF